ncbi:MAG: hypothetical protein ACI92I_000673 [Acidimicrobiales bacterium]|jgi:hypothetical protein
MVLSQFLFALGIYIAYIFSITDFSRIKKKYFYLMSAMVLLAALTDHGGGGWIVSLSYVSMSMMILIFISLKYLRVEVDVLHLVVQMAIGVSLLIFTPDLIPLTQLSIVGSGFVLVPLLYWYLQKKETNLPLLFSYSTLAVLLFVYICKTTNFESMFGVQNGIVGYLGAFTLGWVLFTYVLHVGMLYLAITIFQADPRHKKELQDIYTTISSYYKNVHYHPAFLLGVFGVSLGVIIFSQYTSDTLMPGIAVVMVGAGYLSKKKRNLLQIST